MHCEGGSAPDQNTALRVRGGGGGLTGDEGQRMSVTIMMKGCKTFSESERLSYHL